MTPDKIVDAAERIVAGIQAHGHRVCFEYAGVSTAYVSDESASAEWITQFCEGYFSPSDGTGVADATVYSTGNERLLASLRAFASGSPSASEGRYADVPLASSVTLIRATTTKAGPPEDVYYVLFKEQRAIVMVTSGDPVVRREEGMRAVRALLKWLLLEKGWVPVHSACVAKDGRAMWIAGLKASGKTSTLLNLLARNGCDLVAVDKFLIRDRGRHLEVCGIPGKIGIRVGSAVVQPRLLGWLTSEADSFFPHMDGAQVQRIAESNTPEQLRNRKEKIQMLPAELATLFGASITPTAVLGLLLVPVFDPHTEESRLVRPDLAALNGIAMACYAGLLNKGEGFLRHFFDLSDAALQERFSVLLRRHLPEISAFEVHQGHKTNDQTANLVAGLLEA